MKTAGAMWSWLVVALVGVIVLVVVIGLSLFPRLNAAQRILDSGKPVFDQQRVAGDTLKMTPAQLDAALQANVPRLYQSIVALPLVTGGWFNVPGTARLTMFNGALVRTMPQVRTYLATDVIPFLANRQQDFNEVDTTWPPLTVFAPLLLVVGIVVIVYGAGMLVLSRRAATGRRSATGSRPAAA